MIDTRSIDWAKDMVVAKILYRDRSVITFDFEASNALILMSLELALHTWSIIILTTSGIMFPR